MPLTNTAPTPHTLPPNTPEPESPNKRLVDEILAKRPDKARAFAATLRARAEARRRGEL